LYNSEAVVYIPYNLRGVHWVLLVFKFGPRTVTYYDSMYPDTPGVKEKAINPLLSIFADPKNKSRSVPTGWKINTIADRLQKDTYSCGVFTIMQVRYLLWATPFDIPNDWRRETRRRLRSIVENTQGVR